jgi:hypothetical protein
MKVVGDAIPGGIRGRSASECNADVFSMYAITVRH